MRRVQCWLLFAAIAAVISCGTTNSGSLYDPNAPVAAIDVSTFGTVDSSSRTIALPPGSDDLLLAFKSALSSDGWAVSENTTNTHYVMLLETKSWSYEQRLSYISLSIVDEKTGATILSGVRKTYSPNDNPIDVKAVADSVVSALKKISSPTPDKG